MNRIRHFNSSVRQFFAQDIWKVNLEELSRAKAKTIKYIKVLIITIKTFSAEKIGFQAVALSFFGTMAVVPFVAVAFAVTDGFGLSDKLRELLYANFAGHQDIIDTLLTYANNIITASQSNAMGLISALVFVWLIIWMMMCVERVFNNVWRVRKSRNFFKRFGFYLLILFIAPFIVMLFFSGSIIYTDAFKSIGLGVAYFDTLSSLLAWLDVRHLGGELIFRLEDLDPERSYESFAELERIRQYSQELGYRCEGAFALDCVRYVMEQGDTPHKD